MKFPGILISFLLILCTGSAWSQLHQRLIITGGDWPVFTVDPLGSNPRVGLTNLATFADQWRKELGDENVVLLDVPTHRKSLSQRIYHRFGDSTLLRKTREFLGYTSLHAADSVLALFFPEGFDAEKLDDVKAPSVLVADRYTVAGQSEISVKVIEISATNRSNAFNREFEDDLITFQDFFVKPVTELDTTVTSRDANFGPSSFSSLFHTFQKTMAPRADISLFAPPAEDMTLTKGPKSLAQILSHFRYDNRLVVVELSGESLKEFLEELYGMRFFTLKNTDSDLVRFRVPYYLRDDVSGIRFRVDLTQLSGRRVRIYEMADGSRFDLKRNYFVVMNSFRAERLAEKARSVRVIAEDYREALAEWLLANPGLSPRADDNWTAAPERWVREIAARERKAVFGPEISIRSSPVLSK